MTELDSATLDKINRELESMAPEYRDLIARVIPGLQSESTESSGLEERIELVSPPKDDYPREQVAQAASPGPTFVPDVQASDSGPPVAPIVEPAAIEAESVMSLVAPSRPAPVFVMVPPEVSKGEPTTIASMRLKAPMPPPRRKDRLAARHYSFTAMACAATAIATFFGTTAWHERKATDESAAPPIAAAAKPVPKRPAQAQRPTDIHPDPLLQAAGATESTGHLDLSLGSNLPVEERPWASVPPEKPDSPPPAGNSASSVPRAAESRTERSVAKSRRTRAQLRVRRARRARLTANRITRRVSPVRRTRRVVRISPTAASR